MSDNAVSDKSGLPDFESEGGGAVPPTATILCEFCGRRKARFYLPKLGKWCCAKRKDKCKGGKKTGPFVCPICKKEHNGEYGTGTFCSKRCASKSNLEKSRNSPATIKHIKDISWRHLKPGGWECDICHEKIRSKRKLREHKQEIHGIQYGCKPGFTWQQDKEKAKAARKKQVETLKRRLALGEIKPSFLGRHHSKETREKLSNWKTRQLLNEENLGRRPDVKWYKVKNLDGVEYSQQGTWERDFAVWLNTSGVLWEKRKTIEYTSFDGVKKTYIPDFYLPQTGEYVEIKGLFTGQDRQKMNDVIHSNPNARIYFVHGKKAMKSIMSGETKLTDDLLWRVE